jgi:quercetin dioxygenase-like cupin family protein
MVIALQIVDEADIKETKHTSKWLLGPWNSDSPVEFGVTMLLPDQTVRLHYHETVVEIFYVIEGQCALMTGSDEYHILSEGVSVFIPPKQVHGLQPHSRSPVKLAIVKYPSKASDKIYL